jgi:hypothetical protein
MNDIVVSRRPLTSKPALGTLNTTITLVLVEFKIIYDMTPSLKRAHHPFNILIP